MKNRIIIFVLLLLMYGCSYTGYLQKDFHEPEQTVDKKINLSVVLINSKEFQDYRVQEYTGGYTFTFYFNPAFIEELTKELNKNVFNEVTVVNSLRDLKKYDLQITPSVSYKYIDGTAWGGQFKYAFTPALTVKDAHGNLIDEVKNTQEVVFSQPVGAIIVDVITGLSLFILSPITMPIGTQINGDHAKTVIEYAISRSFKALSYQLANSPKIYNYRKM